MERATSPGLTTLVAVSLGVSTVAFLDCLALLTSPTHDAIYHLEGRASAIFIPVLIDVLLLALACLLALRAAERHPRASKILWAALLCFLPWIAAKNAAMVLGEPFPHLVSASLFLVCVVTFLLFVAATPALNHAFDVFKGLGEIALVCVGIVGAVALVEIAWFAIEARHLNDQTVASAIAPRSAAPIQGRVVWIVLDELAYRQLYEHRLPGLQLPAFDQLRAESTVFSDVQPAGIQTDIVLPSLMTGHRLDKIRSSASGQLFLHGNNGWQSFNQRNTLFADADALGYRSSVVGWYNPYCRILPSVVSSCFWTGPSDLDDLFPTRSIATNALHPLLHLLEKIPVFLHPPKGPSPDQLAEGNVHIREFLQLDHAADAALSDPRNTFLLLHLPIPHPSGIWDRLHSRFAVDRSSYVDNLVLADDYLAHIRHLLEAGGQWDNATILIMGDHAWRTRLLWLKTAAWSKDDQRASDNGQFDPRPAYILKLPHQHTGLDLDTPFPAVDTRALVDQLLLHRLDDPLQLEQWVAQQQSPAPPASVRASLH
jgi:hypothetical protein